MLFLHLRSLSQTTMAACATHSSLMLTYAAPTRSQDLTLPSLISFANPRPNNLSVSLYPPLLLLGGRRCAAIDRGSNRFFPVVVSALAAEADVDTEDAEPNEVASASASAVLDPPKPKKGKAALVLKRDRVSIAFALKLLL